VTSAAFAVGRFDKETAQAGRPILGRTPTAGVADRLIGCAQAGIRQRQGHSTI
jgi:hypothetical protein